MQALTAPMRKLLHAIYGMLKHQQPFDGANIYALAGSPAHATPAFSTTEVV
jgi:hypothetical protein